jgi:hypothetical protein
MPNKYQREIEEILRNLDRNETRPSIGERIRAFNRPRRRPRASLTASLTWSEVLYLVGVFFALAAAGFTFYKGGQVYFLTDWLSVNGLLATIAFAAIVLGLVLGWRDRFRGLTPSLPGNRSWRGAATESNIVELKPARRGPFSALITRFRLIRLKFRYWRTRGRA